MPKPKADRRVGGLVPELNRGTARYAADPDYRPWTQRELAVSFLAVCSCESERDYRTAVPLLMDALDRTPTYPPNAKPTPAEKLRDYVKVFERKIVTGCIGQDRPWFPDHICWCLGLRSGLPYSWGERVKIVTPWRKMVQDEKRTTYPISSGNILFCMNRQWADNWVLDKLVGALDRKANFHDPVVPALLQNPNRTAQKFTDAAHTALNGKNVELGMSRLHTFLTERG